VAKRFRSLLERFRNEPQGFGWWCIRVQLPLAIKWSACGVASGDGVKLFGVLDLEITFDGCRFAIGIRNSNDKSMRLALTAGYRVFVCDNMEFHGDFAPVTMSP